jgi:hypothetical protein
MLGIAMLAWAAGCVEIAGDLPDVAINPGGNARGGDVVSGDGAARDVPRVQDGTSNTIIRDEISGEPAPVTPDPGQQAGGEPSPSPAPSTDAQLVAALSDTFVEFGTSSIFSSGSITESVLIQLCGFGRFGMRVTRITSSTFGDLSSEEFLVGTWTVERGQRASSVLVLSVEQASDPNDVGERRLVLAPSASGGLLVDGAQATISSAAAECATAQQ